MRNRLKTILPVAVLAVAVCIAMVLVVARPQAEQQVRETPAPLVRVLAVEREDIPLVVHTQGTVAPRTEIELVPEVSGRIVEISPALTAGGFFESGELMLEIDPRDYELAVRRADADVAQAEVLVEREKAEAAVARREWESLGQGEAPPLVVREPQLAEARARLAAARAMLDQARLNLERTAVRAPFAGRVRSERVDAGQYVVAGVPVATVYAVDVAEVRLPLPDDQLAYLELPLDNRSEASPGPEVRFKASFAGRTHTWSGRVVRTEGELDPSSRMVHAVAQVERPYDRIDVPGRPPFAVGMFVDAEILGRTAEGVTVVPRVAMRGRSRVLVVDEEDRLRFREIEVLRFDRENVIVSSGLRDGDRVCVSRLDVAVDGMRVRVAAPESDNAQGVRKLS